MITYATILYLNEDGTFQDRKALVEEVFAAMKAIVSPIGKLAGNVLGVVNVLSENREMKNPAQPDFLKHVCFPK